MSFHNLSSTDNNLIQFIRTKNIPPTMEIKEIKEMKALIAELDVVATVKQIF